MHVQIDALVRAHEGVFLHDHRLPVSEIKVQDLAGKLRGKRDLALAPVDVVVNDKEGLAGEGAFEHLPQTAAGIGVHLDVLRHPAHAAGGRVDALAGVQRNGDNRQGCTFDTILH